MTIEEAKKLIKELELQGHSNEEIVDILYRKFVDNKISAYEFKELCSYVNYDVGEDFLDLDVKEQKSLDTTFLTYIKRTAITRRIVERKEVIFNKKYYFTLIDKSRKSIKTTKELIEYLIEIDDFALTFETFKHIKLENIEYVRKHKQILDYVDDGSKKSKTMYDLVIKFYADKKVDNKVKQFVEELLSREDCFDQNINSPQYKLMMYMERLISSIKNERLENSLKLKFLITKKDFYKTKKYDIYLGSCRSLLKKYQDRLSSRTVNEILKYYTLHPFDINSCSPSGYKALFYCLLNREE